MNVPYTIDDFEFVAGFGRFRYGVAVRADSPYKNIQDLVGDRVKVLESAALVDGYEIMGKAIKDANLPRINRGSAPMLVPRP